MASDSDAVGTGERASVGTGRDQPDADILPDHIEQVPGADLDKDLDDTADDGVNGLSEVEDLGDDSEDLEADEGDEEEDPSRKA